LIAIVKLPLQSLQENSRYFYAHKSIELFKLLDMVQTLIYAKLDWNRCDLGQQHFEWHFQKFILILLQDQNRYFKDSFPPILQQTHRVTCSVYFEQKNPDYTYQYEVVPDPLQFPHVFAAGLTLHHLREECYEEG